LSYTDNGDGTFTDNNTNLIWEIKYTSGGIHDVGNLYTWSVTSPNADGTLFTDFLYTLNNTCAGDETTQCTSNKECKGIGNELCGLGGYRDWRIPNIKELQSIVDYGTHDPALSVPDEVGFDGFYWSATTFYPDTSNAWLIDFLNGRVNIGGKAGFNSGRAVRP
jgi:hypothetical protein